MQICQALSIAPTLPQVIALVGGGGKTSTLLRLAQELKAHGKRILIATTTKIFMPSPNQYDQLWLGEPPCAAAPGTIHVWAPRHLSEIDKLDSIPTELSAPLLATFDHILIEADGAKHKPLKAPRKGEPVLPQPCHLVVALTGWEALSQPLTPHLVHRWPEFKALTGARTHHPLTAEQLTPLLEGAQGLFNGFEGPRIWLINKLDDPAQLCTARPLARKMLSLCPALDGIVLASLHAPDPVHERIVRGSV